MKHLLSEHIIIVAIIICACALYAWDVSGASNSSIPTNSGQLAAPPIGGHK